MNFWDDLANIKLIPAIGRYDYLDAYDLHFHCEDHGDHFKTVLSKKPYVDYTLYGWYQYSSLNEKPIKRIPLNTDVMNFQWTLSQEYCMTVILTANLIRIDNLESLEYNSVKNKITKINVRAFGPETPKFRQFHAAIRTSAASSAQPKWFGWHAILDSLSSLQLID